MLYFNMIISPYKILKYLLDVPCGGLAGAQPFCCLNDRWLNARFFSRKGWIGWPQGWYWWENVWCFTESCRREFFQSAKTLASGTSAQWLCALEALLNNALEENPFQTLLNVVHSCGPALTLKQVKACLELTLASCFNKQTLQEVGFSFVNLLWDSVASRPHSACWRKAAGRLCQGFCPPGQSVM